MSGGCEQLDWELERLLAGVCNAGGFPHHVSKPFSYTPTGSSCDSLS